ncbi:MAG: quinone-interacting membrane-bound oxidoreductase complex subunit QmoC [Thermodesulfobacteriota bacterium]|nr:quinone-interacting membrane-bound oxidoreductase complex subunit QmoC [Thermodesulfobacteriota bacterium]
MKQENYIEPDSKFIKNIINRGGGTLKKCFQCATCSVMCKLSPDYKPFPRKEMIWSQWGLKDRLIQDPDVWLCHQCNDCSVNCPRGAAPGDVLDAVRRSIIEYFSLPKFLGKMVGEPKFLPVILTIPVLLVLLLISLSSQNGHGFNIDLNGEILFRNFILYNCIDIAAVILTLFIVICYGTGLFRFWKELNKNPLPPGATGVGIVSGVIKTVVELLTHNKFKECEANSLRYWAHLFIWYGFLLLFVATTIVFLGIQLTHLKHDLNLMPPWGIISPIKIFGNLGAIALLVGLILVIYNRLTNEENAGKATYFDWSFIILLLVVTITGILTEIIRMASLALLAYIMYTLHLVFVFALLLYMPYSKFAHFLYRFLALVHAKVSGRSI